MSQPWFYADRQRQQQGPVTAAELVAALQRGEVDMGTLVWNERLPSWVPLQQVARQLGIAGSPPPMPAAAPRRAAAPRKSGSKVWIIVILVLLGCLVVFGGIIAAIAIPAYHDYTVRARVSQAYLMGSSQRTAVAEFYAEQQRCPQNGDDGFGAPDSYAGAHVAAIEFGPGGGGCEIRVKLPDVDVRRMPNAELTLRMDSGMNWSASADGIPTRYQPAAMRR